MSADKVTVLGSNGHFGYHAARAFVAAGWEVTRFGRADRRPVGGARFVVGDAGDVETMRRAIGDSELVVHALNLPYHQWDHGRMEAQTQKVVQAAGEAGRTLLFPGNIYNYGRTDREITPDLPQRPETPRGAIRKRVEEQLRQAAFAGRVQVIVLRAGDFFGPESSSDWFDQVILRELGNGKLALLGKSAVAHSWAYLPDLARASTLIAERRKQFGPFETFHFAGHFVTPEDMARAVQAVAPVALRTYRFPWALMSLIGIANPLIREVAKMGYLWRHPMRLRDDRLDALLGSDFQTPLEQAVAATVRPHFSAMQRAA